MTDEAPTASIWDRRLGAWWIAEDEPDLLAIVSSPSGRRTYGQLIDEVHQLVHAFRALGLEPGDTLAAMLPNGIEIVELSLACQEAGWYFTPLNTFLTGGELGEILAHSDAKALVVHQQFSPVLDDPAVHAARGTTAIVAVGEIAGAPRLDDLRMLQPASPPEDRRNGGLFTYTSGTTGKPKGIRRPLPVGDPSEVASAGAVFGRAFDFRPLQGPHLASTAMYHGGSHSFYMGALHVGHGLVIMSKFDPEETLRLIERHRVTSAYMVPTQFHRLLRLPQEVRDRYDVSSLRTVVHSAAPCPKDVKQQMLDWWGPVIWETYGGMEGPATIAKPRRWLERPGTVGRAIKGVKLTILDEEGQPLPAGEAGAVYMENDSGFEYHRDAEGTSHAFRGKRFTLGDIGYLDADGYLFIQDRAKDMIITGGVNVYPAEVEAVLSSHPLVADVGVIGVPDPEWGEQIKAVVQLDPSAEPSPELATELVAYCRDRLASYKCPRSVDFRDDLPRTDAGKLYKRRLRDEYWPDTGAKL
jgi:long-chain acyl-CoA synthetase